MRITRYQMYKSIFSALHIPLKGEVLGISGLKFWIGSPNYNPPVQIISKDARITQADYPEVVMDNLPYKDNTFDYVICDQVLEHIEGDVQKSINEARRVLKPNGIAVFATVFIHPIHWGPKDMWRFSLDALRYLCRDFSEIIQCESWGNRWILALFFLYENARDWYVPKHNFSIVKKLATLNDPKYPSSTWIIVRK
jgi:SAM-dependent methyltransferase